MYKENKQTEKFRLIRVLWLMYVLFPFYLRGIVVYQNIIFYGVSILFTVYFFYKLFSARIERGYISRYFLYLLLFLALTIFSALIPFFKGTGDYSYTILLLTCWGRIFVLTGTVILSNSVIRYINLLIDAINSYVICSIVLLIPRLHSFYMSILDSSTLVSSRAEEFYSQDYYTRFGLLGFSGFGCTLMCAAAVLLCCFMIVNKIGKEESISKYVWRMIISLVGTAMYGRVGLFASVLLIVITLVYLAIKYKKFAILSGSIFSAVLIVILFVANASYLQQISSIRWMFEGFFNYLDYGTFTTKSTEALGNMYFWPGAKTFFWGDGYYNVAGRYYMGTDVGFLRPLLFGGIYFELLYYATILPLLSVINKNFTKRNGSFLLFIIIIFLVFFEFKGEVLISFSYIVYTIVCAILLSKRINIK